MGKCGILGVMEVLGSMWMSMSSRAVQRSHRAERYMAMMLWHACARHNAFLVSQWHETRPTRQVRPACLSRARGVALNLYNKIRSGAMCVREIEIVVARSV
jgi:hypothetical protein